MNSIQYLNVSHIRSIRKIQRKRNDIKVRKVYEFRVEPQTGKILVVCMGEEPLKQSPQKADQIMQDTLLGRRERKKTE